MSMTKGVVQMLAMDGQKVNYIRKYKKYLNCFIDCLFFFTIIKNTNIYLCITVVTGKVIYKHESVQRNIEEYLYI